MGNLFSSRDEVDISDVRTGRSDQDDLYVPREAKQLRDSARSMPYGPERDAKFERAAQLIFRHNNEGKHRPENEIDLHGLYREEAVEFAEQKISALQDKFEQLIFIVGRGNHSTDNKPVLKAAVADYLGKHNLRYDVGKPNEGCITVYFDRSQSWCIVL